LLVLISLTALGGGCSDNNPFSPGTTPVYSSWHDEPDWSSDGLIAYRKSPSSGETPGVWVLDPETGDESLVIENGMDPAWSADGKKIACSIGGCIVTCTSGGALLHQISSAGCDRYPAWSSNDSLVVWCAPFTYRGGLWAAPAAGGPEENWYRDGWYPDWHPDGDRVLFVGRQDTLNIMGEYWPSTGAVSIVMVCTNPSAWWWCPSYSPDASRIAYEWHAPERLTQIRVVDADGSNMETLTTHGGVHPSWSPDGTRIVYVRQDASSDAPEVGVLWVVDVATGQAVQLTEKPE
jgi:hypothetical protein